MRSFVKFKPSNSSGDSRKFGEAYYAREVKTLRPFRLFGALGSLIALSLTVIGICSPHWIQGKGFSAGVWSLCSYNATESDVQQSCSATRPYWQNAVIGLLIFSVAFGFLATILSICGTCTSALPRKIYYFHSAGEIYLVCALACTSALITYPVGIERGSNMGPHSYGFGYGLGWGASFFFFAAATCMCLDDLIHTFAKGICNCFGLKNSSDTRV